MPAPGWLEVLDTLSEISAERITSGVLNAARIPDLNASKITEGQFALALIPNLGADKITSGILPSARIGNLPASKITSGEFDTDRIPTLTVAKIPNLPISKITDLQSELDLKLEQEDVDSTITQALDNFTIDVDDIPNLPASKINQGTFHVDRIPNLSALKVTSGQFSLARMPRSATTGQFLRSAGSSSDPTYANLVESDVPTLSQSKISNLISDLAGKIPAGGALSDINSLSTGTINAARIASLPINQITNLQTTLNGKVNSADVLTALNAITSGTINVARIPNLDASKINSGQLNIARMPRSSSGFLKAQGVSSDPSFTALAEADIPNLGISKITNLSTSLGNKVEIEDLLTELNKKTGEINVGLIPDLNANKITDGAFAVERIPSLSADKITSGTFGQERIATNAIIEAKINNGAVTANKIGTNAVTETKIANGAVKSNKINIDEDLSFNNKQIKDIRIETGVNLPTITPGQESNNDGRLFFKGGRLWIYRAGTGS